MRLSALQIARWVNEIADQLTGRRIGFLHKDEVRKRVGIDLGEKRLSYIFLPGESLICLENTSNSDSRGSSKTTNFLPQLVGAEITAIEQVQFDRIVRFALRQEEREFSLIFELFGPGSNVYLLDADGSVITSLRQAAQTETYAIPQPPPGMPPGEIDTHIIVENAAAEPSVAARDFFINQIRGCDPSFWEIALAEIDDQTQIGELSRDDIESILSRISSCYRECVSGEWSLLADETAIRWIMKSDSADGYTNLNDAICDIAIDLSRKSAERSIRQRIANGIKSQRKKLESKLGKLEKVVKDAEHASRYKEWAELLTINISKIRRGMTTVTVQNLYDENMPEIAIPLLPELSPSANIKRLFKRYRKLTDGKTVSETQIAQIHAELDRLHGYRERLERAESLGDLLKLDKELVKAKLLKTREAPISSHRAEPEAEFNPRQYTTPAGEQILVGRNNRENEFVSFVAAKKHDIWFHSQQTPGSHVILKLKDKNIEPTHESILVAAQIAAYYSQARTSEKVPIIYTEARYLQKIKGGPPGKVRYSRVKSIMVEPALP